MLSSGWFLVSPIKISFTPFDYNAVLVDTSDKLFKNRMNHWMLGPFGDFMFEASPISVHLFWITVFIAVVAPFGALFFTVLKRALKAEQLG